MVVAIHSRPRLFLYQRKLGAKCFFFWFVLTLFLHVRRALNFLSCEFSGVFWFVFGFCFSLVWLFGIVCLLFLLFDVPCFSGLSKCSDCFFYKVVLSSALQFSPILTNTHTHLWQECICKQNTRLWHMSVFSFSVTPANQKGWSKVIFFEVYRSNVDKTKINHPPNKHKKVAETIPSHGWFNLVLTCFNHIIERCDCCASEARRYSCTWPLWPCLLWWGPWRRANNSPGGRGIGFCRAKIKHKHETYFDFLLHCYISYGKYSVMIIYHCNLSLGQH